jgi:hypothetical protein
MHKLLATDTSHVQNMEISLLNITHLVLLNQYWGCCLRVMTPGTSRETLIKKYERQKQHHID